MIRTKFFLIGFLLFSFFIATSDEKVKDIKPKKSELLEALEKHVKTLSSEEYEGRAANAKGIELAADYIIQEFKKAGIQPLPQTKKYRQEFEIVNSLQLLNNSTFEFINTTTQIKTPITIKRQAIFLGENVNLKDKEIIFIGYGITKENYDDYAGVDVKDKVVLMLRYEPEETTAESYSASKHAWLRTKYKLAIKHGVAAILFINSPNGIRTKDKDSFLSLRTGRSLKRDLAKMPMIQFEKSLITLIEEQTKLSFADIQEKIDEKKKPNSFSIKGIKININVGVQHKSFKTNNVIGFIPGSDKTLSKESIVVGAHFDHIGFGHFGSRLGKAGNGKLHPGADDNASGTAAVIEAARYLQKNKIQLKRNIIFILFSAEEMGLFGSKYCVTSEEIKSLNVVAMVNLDMVGNYNAKQTLRINGISSSKVFKPLLNKSNLSELKITYSLYSPHNGQTDHQSFFLEKIPAMAFFTGFTKNYHGPTDTYEHINFDGLEKIATVLNQFLKNISTYNSAIEFNTTHQFNKKASFRNIHFNRSKKAPIIKRITKNSPEEKAGLKPNDIVLEIDYIKINFFGEYYSILRDRAIGETLQIKVKRKIPVKVELEKPEDEKKKKVPQYKELELFINL